MYFSLAVLDNEFRLLPSCKKLRCLWVCCLDGSHGLIAWGSIACLGCQKIFTCETRVLHSTPQSLTYWLRRLPFRVAWGARMRGKATGAHRPLPREKICIYFPPFSPIHQNIKMCRFFAWMSHNQSRIVSGQSASKRLKNRVKKWPVHRVRSHAIYRARRSSIPAFSKFCAVYMTFLPLVSARPIKQLPQSIILIRLDVTSSFR